MKEFDQAGVCFSYVFLCIMKVSEKQREYRMTVEKGESISEVFRMFKDAVTTVAVEMVGFRVLRGQRKGRA